VQWRAAPQALARIPFHHPLPTRRQRLLDRRADRRRIPTLAQAVHLRQLVQRPSSTSFGASYSSGSRSGAWGCSAASILEPLYVAWPSSATCPQARLYHPRAPAETEAAAAAPTAVTSAAGTEPEADPRWRPRPGPRCKARLPRTRSLKLCPQSLPAGRRPLNAVEVVRPAGNRGGKPLPANSSTPHHPSTNPLEVQVLSSG
jgi:hypothetical protein